MKTLHSFIVPALAAAALLLPAAAIAQQAPPAPNASASPAEQWQGREHHQRGMMRMFRSLNLSEQQQTRIQQIMQQYRQAHPEGSAPDPEARRQLRTQLMNVLTPQQQAQLKQHMEQMRMQREQEDGAPQPQSTPQA